MRHIRKFESPILERKYEYDTIEITDDDEWNGAYNTIEFTPIEIESIRTYFSKKGIKLNEGKSYLTAYPRRFAFFIYKPNEDEWYDLEVQYYANKGDDFMSIKHYRCDQLGGLFEVLDEYLKDFKDNPEYASQLKEKIKRDKLRKEINSKIKTLTNDELEKLKSYLYK